MHACIPRSWRFYIPSATPPSSCFLFFFLPLPLFLLPSASFLHPASYFLFSFLFIVFSCFLLAFLPIPVFLLTASPASYIYFALLFEVADAPYHYIITRCLYLFHAEDFTPYSINEHFCTANHFMSTS
jgi:hypothetical protein